MYIEYIVVLLNGIEFTHLNLYGHIDSKMSDEYRVKSQTQVKEVIQNNIQSLSFV